MESGQQLAFDEGIKWACARRGCDQEDHEAVVRLLKYAAPTVNPLSNPNDPDLFLGALRASGGGGDMGNTMWGDWLSWGQKGTLSNFKKHGPAAIEFLKKKHGMSESQARAAAAAYLSSNVTESGDRAEALTALRGMTGQGTETGEVGQADVEGLLQEETRLRLEESRDRLLEASKQREERKKQTRYSEIARTQGPRAAQMAQMDDQHAAMDAEKKKLMLDPRSKALEGSPERRMWNERVMEMDDRMGENRRIAEGRPLTAEEKVKRQQRADANSTKARDALMESAVESAVHSIETGASTPSRAISRALNGEPGLEEEVSKAVLQRLEAKQSPMLNKARQSLAPLISSAGPAATPPAAGPAATPPATGPAATPPAADPAATPPATGPAATPPAADPAATPPAADPAATPPAAGPLAAGRKPGVPSAAVTQASKLPTRSIARELTPEMMAQERMQMQLRYGTKGTGGDAQITNLQPRQTPMTGSAPNSLGQAQAIGQVASSKMKMVGGMGVVPPNQSNMPAGADVAQAGPRPSPAKTGVISPPPEPGGSNKSDSMSA